MEKIHYLTLLKDAVSKVIFVVTLIPSFLSQSFPQNENEFVTELFTLTLNNKSLSVIDKIGKETYTNAFNNPVGFLADLDMDGNDEFLVRDSVVTLDNEAQYELYIYNVLDTFFLARKINSGTTEPYESDSGEIEGLIIVTGNTDFSYLNENSEFISLPINCWKFEDGEVYIINDEIYDQFMTENNTISSTLDNFLAGNKNNCDASLKIKSLIASAYINYLNAGENSAASNFMRTYYPCDDAEQFKKELDNIFSNEKH